MDYNNDDEGWMGLLRMIRENCPYISEQLDVDGQQDFIQDMSDEDWEQLGRDISNNTHLESLLLVKGALNDHKISFLFQGLRSSSIKDMSLNENELSVAAVRSMVPFLQNANNLQSLALDKNNIQSEGFNMLFRALCDSPIEELSCKNCGIESIEIDNNHIPKHLKTLYLNRNSINADGCREIAKLLRGEDSTLTNLYLASNFIDDEGVEILVGALQNNTALASLNLLGRGNNLTKQGTIMLLKLVNDISSIEATLRSNHTLRYIILTPSDEDAQIHEHIRMATVINRLPEEAARAKVIQTQLQSATRAILAELQGANHSLYSEINPLHLPEVLALVGRHHGQIELYVALRSSIAELTSTVNRKEV